MSDAVDLTERLEKLYTGAVHDVLRAMGHGNCVLPNEIKSLDPGKKVAGEIYTVSGHIDQSRDPHDTLVQWTGLLSAAPPGKVLVCQPNTHMVALMESYQPRPCTTRMCAVTSSMVDVATQNSS